MKNPPAIEKARAVMGATFGIVFISVYLFFLAPLAIFALFFSLLVIASGVSAIFR